MAENIDLPTEAASYSVLALKMQLRPYQEHMIDKRFEVARKIYNSLLALELKKYKKLTRTPEYREIQNEIESVLDEYSEETQEEILTDEGPVKKRKLNPAYRTDQRYRNVLKARNVLLRDNGYLGAYSFQKDLAPLKAYYETVMVDGKRKQKPHIGAQVLNMLAINAWKALSGHIYKGEKVNFIRKGELNTLCSSNPRQPMQLQNGVFKWFDLSCAVKIDPKDIYAAEMMQMDPTFYRVVRKTENTKNNYYVQIVLKGAPVRKRYRLSGNYKHTISPDAIGVDIGMSCVAVVSERHATLFPLAPHAQLDAEKKEELQAFLSRSRFKNNPHRFHTNGTIRKLPKNSKERYWVSSKAYLKTKAEIREMDRYGAVVRKDDHGYLANYILSLGSEITMEKIDYRGLVKREEKTKKYPSGQIKTKKRYGASILNRAPAMLVSKLESKAANFAGKPIHWVDPKLAQVSKYDHTADQYVASRPYEGPYTLLSNGDRVEQHLYNAFLLSCITCDKIDSDKCKSRYENFKKMHDAQMRSMPTAT